MDNAKEWHTDIKTTTFTDQTQKPQLLLIFTCMTEGLALTGIGTELFTSRFTSHALSSKTKISFVSVLEILWGNIRQILHHMNVFSNLFFIFIIYRISRFTFITKWYEISAKYLKRRWRKVVPAMVFSFPPDKA